MKSKQINFFSTILDLEAILREIENVFDINYFKMGLFDSKDIPSFKSILTLSDLGFTKHGDWNYVDSYLILPENFSLDIREISQKKGGTKYAVDQMVNPKSIELKCGGIYLEKENIIVAGRIATISDNAFSQELYKSFSKLITKRFRKIDGFYVGDEAQEKLKLGWRLVTNEKLSKEYDLLIK
jgi:hypothetical protein